LVIVKGRRRIGKSRLATELARRLPGYSALSFQGLPPTAHLTAEQEREDFAQQINRQLGIPAPRADDWNTLFWSLADRTRTGRIWSFWMKSTGSDRKTLRSSGS